jgi:cell division transport system permease protein
MNTRLVAWRYIRRSPYQSLAAVMTLFITFLVAGFYILVTSASSAVLEYFESKPQITVFFTDEATKEDADKLTQELKNTGKSASFKYVSKEDALTLYQEQNKDDPLLLEMVSADILPASLEVTAISPEYLADFEKIISAKENVEEVIYQKDVVDSLLAWSNAARVAGFFLAALLIFDSFFVIMTVIGMKIAIRKEEIEILKLVGASPWYIRLPFVYEGMLYGLSGAFLAWTILTGLILSFRPVILSVVGIVPSVAVLLDKPAAPLFLFASGGFLALLTLSGTVLGILGSLVSVGRYLKFR